MRWTMKLLLYLFPARFRKQYGADMLATFEDRWEEQHGAGVAARIVADLIWAGIRERFSFHTSPNDKVLETAKQGDGAMNGLWQDSKYAVRTLRRSPGFTIVALATLALGIGVNTAMFSVAHEALWRSMPYPHPERVVMVGEVEKSNPDMYWGTSFPNFKDWQAAK